MEKFHATSRMSCCVDGCTNAYYNTEASTKFYNFPGRWYEAARKQIWINSIGKVSGDGKGGWQPKTHHKICSAHFVGNKKSNNPNSPAYNPTIFPKNRWGAAQVEALIDEYKKNPILYDSNHEHCNDAMVKAACLGNIVAALQPCRPGTTQADVVSQWNALVEHVYGQQESHDSNLPRKSRSWYIQKLEFVKEHLGAREEHQEWNVDVDPLASTSEIDIKEETLELPPAERLKSNEESETSCEESDSKSSKDENDVFGDFVALQLKKITNETTRQDAILEIHRVLHKALKR